MTSQRLTRDDEARSAASTWMAQDRMGEHDGVPMTGRSAQRCATRQAPG